MPLVKVLGSERSIGDVRPVDLVAYAHTLREKSYSDATRRKHIKSLKTFFNWLVKIEVLETSPARFLRQEKLKPYVDRDKAMSDPELRKLLEYARWKPRDYALILFLADTGCRAGGAAGLKLEHLDLVNRRATVMEKGEQTRPVKFGRATCRALAQWLQKRPTVGGYIFSRDGSPIQAKNLSQVVRRDCLAAGLRSLGSHSLRHRKGHQMADARIAPSIAARALGHKDVMTTMHNYFPSDFASAEAVLEELAFQEHTASITPLVAASRSA